MAARRMVARIKEETGQRIAMGVGAAAVAVPVGVWLGRKVARR